jgi:MarR family 2-MHQ and catechol resistance regulon transcriptional repressor
MTTPQDTAPATASSPSAPASRPADLVDVFADDRLTVMGLFAETWTALAARGAQQLAAHGLSPVEFDVMIRLARSPRLTLRMTDLSAQTSLTTSGVTRVVDRLQDRGLVAREACMTDRRTTYAVITDLGRDHLAAALPGQLELIQASLVAPLTGADASAGSADAGGGCTAAGLESFVASLRTLRDHLAPCATAGSTGAGVPPQQDRPGA